MILPFLYPARALRTRAPAVRAFLRHLHDNARPDEPATPPPRRPRRPALQRDPIPFELPPDMASELERAAERDGDQGTITPSERQAFRRLFGDLAERQRAAAAAEAAAAEAADETPGATPSTPTETPVRERINTIVDKAAAEAAGEQQARTRGGRAQAVRSRPLTEDEQRRQVLASFPPSLRAAAGTALGIKDAERQRAAAAAAAAAAAPATNGEDGVAAPAPVPTAPTAASAATTAAAQARQARQTKMELLMLAQKSDFALWDYMEANVFSLVAELGLAEGKGTAKAKTKTKAKGKAKTTTPSPAHLAAYAPLYPALLLHGLRLLDTHFHGGRTSPLALALLPRVKALGLASHVLGASTPLYNRLLRIHWTRRGDARAVFALLAEMQRAGLAFDGDTRALLQSMEWHLLPVYGGGGLAAGGPGLAAGGLGSGLARAAVRTLPELATVPGELAYWRAQVDRGIALAQR